MNNAYQITYRGKQYKGTSGQTVLDCLLSQGVTIPNSCRSGICCSCMMKSNSDGIPAQAQNGLKDTLRNQGYFLACVCKPEGDLEIQDSDTNVRVQAKVYGLRRLNDEVIQLSLRTSEPFEFKAGQYLSLIRNDSLMRSYSIASLPQSGLIELHVRIIPQGKMSSWILNSVQIGDQISIRGPFGNCYYAYKEEQPDSKNQPLLLVGTGTGLAPLYGILQDALHQGHCGPIELFHGGTNPTSLYLAQELKELTLQHPNFHYRPCVLKDGNDSIPEIPLDQHILKNFQFLKNARIYLCGDPQLVNTLRKKLFLAGASSKEIYADAFLPSLA